ncbi:hypothetical protein [Actinokineospora terrae]|uniref:Uncharacterized protein n=1 Tax=Actinokineospora terrae TaxID=155974 RepID=A0A1H9SDP6_9PSEU|nr:hypothetical protein [Actinokineospora terrae]SER83150.1 hypothetical protein SAMN04487818_105408 [Actinokineospora terrae]
MATARFTARSSLPGALLLALFGACLLLALFAPSREYEQIHYVAVDHGQDTWTNIPRAALACAELDRVETCVVDVAGRRLEVVLRRGLTDGGPISCTARYADKPKPCDATFAYSEGGDGAVAVLSSGIGLTAAEVDQITDAGWSIPSNVAWVAISAVVGLAVLAALVAGLGGTRPIEDGHPLVWTAGLGWFVLLFFAVSMLGGTLDALAHPVVVVVGVLLMCWQLALAKPGHRLGAGRAAVAFVMTALTTSVALFVFLRAGAFLA